MCLPPSFDIQLPAEREMTLRAVRQHHADLTEAVYREQHNGVRNGPARTAYVTHLEEHRAEGRRQAALRAEAREALRVEQGVLVRAK